jgi:hypothetical protein
VDVPDEPVDPEGIAVRPEQGATLGVAQSAGSLARIIGPIYANVLFTAHPAWTYLSCAVVALIAGGVAAKKLSSQPSP